MLQWHKRAGEHPGHGTTQLNAIVKYNSWNMLNVGGNSKTRKPKKAENLFKKNRKMTQLSRNLRVNSSNNGWSLEIRTTLQSDFSSIQENIQTHRKTVVISF